MISKTFSWFILLGLGVPSATLASPACDSTCQSMRTIAEKAARSVVSLYILNDKAESIDTRFTSLGSGFFYKNCVIVTNAHVVDNNFEIGVAFPDDSRGSLGRVLAKEERFDLALVEVTGKRCTPLEVTPEEEIKVATPVLSLGNSLGLDHTLTRGVISAINRSVGTYHRYIQFDAPIFPGNSGGPLLTLDGRVAGVNTLAHKDKSGIGFAFPGFVLERIFPELSKNKKMKQRYLGVTVEQFSNKEKYSIKDYQAGVKIASIKKDSPAEQAKLKVGDLITGVGSKRISNIDDLELELYSYALDTFIVLEVQREKTKLELKLQIKALEP